MVSSSASTSIVWLADGLPQMTNTCPDWQTGCSIFRCLPSPRGRRSFTRSCSTRATCSWLPRSVNRYLTSMWRSVQRRSVVRSTARWRRKRRLSVSCWKRPSCTASECAELLFLCGKGWDRVWVLGKAHVFLVSLQSPLRQLQCFSDWKWPLLVLWRKMSVTSSFYTSLHVCPFLFSFFFL